MPYAFGAALAAYTKLYPATRNSSATPMISRTTSNTNAPFMTVSCLRRLEALFSSPDMYTDQKFHIRKPWMENRVGPVALTLPRFGPTCCALAPEMTWATVPPPKLWFSLLKLASKPLRLATASAMKATMMPTMAIRNAPFCQRNVALVPKARITVCSTTMNSAAPIIQAWLVSNEDPQLISVLLWARAPPETRAGPSANTEKNLAKYAAPSRPPMIMHRLEMSASGGDRTRLTQT